MGLGNGRSVGRRGDARMLVDTYAAIATARDGLIVATMTLAALTLAARIPGALRTADVYGRPVALYIPGAHDGSVPPHLALAEGYLDLLATLPPLHPDLPALVHEGLTALAEAVTLRDDERAILAARIAYAASRDY